jgi:tight adherence protein B
LNQSLLLVSALLTGLTALTVTPLLLAWTDTLHASMKREITAFMRSSGLEIHGLDGWLRFWRFGTIGSLVLLPAMGLAPIGLITAFLCHKLVPIYLYWRIDQHRLLVESQVSGATRQLAGQLRAGASLTDGLEQVTEKLPMPLKRHFQMMTVRQSQGADFSSVLDDLRATLNLESITVFVVVLKVALEKGGPLAEILERITRSLQELERLRRKREADTAAGRAMITVLALFPAAFLALISIFDPALSLVFITTIVGQLVLAVSALLTYLSVRWAGSILKSAELGT